jgi:hypothetical protein
MEIENWDGKPIDHAGIYADVPIGIYHSQDICAGPSVSSSGLRRVLERNGGSPAHFYDEWSGNPNRQEQEEEKQHFILGRAVHHLLLGEGFFRESFAIREEANATWSSWRTEAARAWRDELFRAGRMALTASDIEDIRGMCEAMAKHPEVNIQFEPGRYYSLLNGHIEKSFIWKDKPTGLWCKARPDAIPTDSGDYADLKTTTSVAYQAIQRAITDHAYHQQAAMIAEGARQCAGPLSSYTLVFVEKRRPYCVRPVPLDMEDILLGHEQNRIALDLVARCLRDKAWPGPGDANITSIRLADGFRTAVNRDIAETKHVKEKVA